MEIVVYDNLHIERSFMQRVRAAFHKTGTHRVTLDGETHFGLRCAWALWIPTLQMKFLNSANGRLACLSRHAPRFTSGPTKESGAFRVYAREDWQAAYGKPVTRRAAENFVAAQRLALAGLGPRVRGLCLARQLYDCGRRDSSFAAGLMIDDARRMQPKPPATAEDIVAAGVQPDRIGSAVRQQVNGHVVDLNSVVGVMPIDAESEIAAVEAALLASLQERSSAI